MELEVLKPGDTVFITRNQREAKVVSVDGDKITVRPDWSLFLQTFQRYQLQSSSEWMENYDRMEMHRHRQAMVRILGDGQMSTEDLARRLQNVSSFLNSAENNNQTQAVRKLVATVGFMLGKFDTKFEILQERIDKQDKEIEQLHKFARGERRL